MVFRRDCADADAKPGVSGIQQRQMKKMKASGKENKIMSDIEINVS